MLEKKTGSTNHWVQVTLRDKRNEKVTTLISAHLPHSGYALDVFSTHMASLQRPPSQRVVFGGDINVDLTQEGAGLSEDAASRAALV